MATLKRSPFGTPTGKIGDLIFYELYGKPVCRLIGDPGPKSELQKANCEAMAITTKLLKPIFDFIKVGYGQKAKGGNKNPQNLATAYHKKHALKGVYPNIKVDFTKVIVSQGELSQITDVQVSKRATGLQFKWNPKLKFKPEEYDDQVMILIYYTARRKADKYLNAARRSEGRHFITMHQKDLDAPLAVYISLKSANGLKISDSMYLGMLNQPEEDLPLSVEATEIVAKKEEQKKISDLETRFKQLGHLYLQQLIAIEEGKSKEDKAFIALEAEYLTLKASIRRHAEVLSSEKQGPKLLDD